MKREGPPRGLTESGLSGLLARLDADAERAGAAYEALRHALMRFFDWRGAAAPDTCADEALDRLARRIAEGEVIADVRNYAHGIARLVWLEHSRAPEGRVVSLDATGVVDLPAPVPAALDSPLSSCFDRCLDTLPADGRRLILEYYTHERHGQIAARAELARTLALSPNALRSRAQRLRDRLERCVNDCVSRTLAPGLSTSATT